MHAEPKSTIVNSNIKYDVYSVEVMKSETADYIRARYAIVYEKMLSLSLKDCVIAEGPTDEILSLRSCITNKAFEKYFVQQVKKDDENTSLYIRLKTADELNN